MVGMAAVLILPGDSLQSPIFAEFHAFNLTETFWAGAFGSMGVGRITVLWINGRSPKTPIFRVLGAAFGFISWGKLAVMLHNGSYAAYGAESLGLGIYGPLMMIEAISIYRASYDARYQPGR